MSYKPGMAVIAAALICTLGTISSPSAIAQTKNGEAAKEQSKKDNQAPKISDRSHPDYVRCRSEPVIGSLVRKRKICMTNSEWEEYARAGNADSRSMLDDIGKGGMNGPQ